MRKGLAFVLLYCLLQTGAGGQVISIDSQERFDSIMTLIKTALKENPAEIVVNFSPGTYYYDERLLRMDGMKYPQTVIRFMGNGATLTAKGEDYSDGDIFLSDMDSGSGITSGQKDVFVWSKVYFSDGRIKPIDQEKKLFRIKCKSIRKHVVADLSNCYLLLTEWYRSRIMKVHSIENGSVIFTADENWKDLNMDFDYAWLSPRFKLLNSIESPFYIRNGRVHLDTDLPSIHISQVGRLFTAYKASFKSLSFNGFRFVGNRDNVYAMMDFTETMTEGISISDCEFCGLRSKIIQVAFSPDFHFCNNYVHDCYRSGVESFAAPRTRILDNTFNNVGLAMNNDFCICCSGENYLISRNKISDFGYGGIALGMHYLQERTSEITGTVEHNELWYSQGYMENYPDHTLMDSGAIYVYTQNDRAMIRDNYIHDYIGMKDNRGIFLDDGASHVLVLNNTILRVPNSWSIDSRRVKEVENAPGSQVKQANVGNLIHGNKVDGQIRFEK